ncbi:MAG: hypothetical protein IKB88_01775 [Clostridia bacterium]|nr:hypothetical protein [Clostridia bacterium]
MNEKLNLRHPKTFNEKMQWLKLYDRKPQYSVMVDKAAVKNYIAEKIGEKYLIPTIGVYKNTDEIPFDELPQKFVIKCTHDSGSVFLCDKEKGIDTEKLKAEITKKLNIPFIIAAENGLIKTLLLKLSSKNLFLTKTAIILSIINSFALTAKWKYSKLTITVLLITVPTIIIKTVNI